MALNPRCVYGPAQPAASLLAAPSGVQAPAASGAGTTTTTGTKYFVLTLVNLTGETVASAQVSVNNTAANTITVTSTAWPANMAITKTNVYEGTASGGPYYLQGNITTSGGTLSITTEPNTGNSPPPGTGTAIQPVLIGTVGTASGSGAPAWLASWTDLFIKSIVLGNPDTVSKVKIGVHLVRSGQSPSLGNQIIPSMQVDLAGTVGKNPLLVIPFSNLDMQSGDALYALQYQASPLAILTVEGAARP